MKNEMKTPLCQRTPEPTTTPTLRVLGFLICMHCGPFICPGLKLRQIQIRFLSSLSQTTSSLSFFCSPSSKTRDTQMATRVTDGSRAPSLLSLNRKKKRDCSQSIIEQWSLCVEENTSGLKFARIIAVAHIIVGVFLLILGLPNAGYLFELQG